MKVPKTFPTRAAANEEAAKLRKKYVSVLVYPKGNGFGVSYDENHRRTTSPKKRK